MVFDSARRISSNLVQTNKAGRHDTANFKALNRCKYHSHLRGFSNPISSVILSQAVPFAIPSFIFSKYTASFSLNEQPHISFISLNSSQKPVE